MSRLSHCQHCALGKNRASYTGPLLEVVGGIESSAKELFVGASALAKLSRLTAFFSAGNQTLEMEGSEVGGHTSLATQPREQASPGRKTKWQVSLIIAKLASNVSTALNNIGTRISEGLAEV
eukprot:g22142.t1